jgi:outer membrane protein OmpA-like peptidoglycan-associated protein
MAVFENAVKPRGAGAFVQVWRVLVPSTAAKIAGPWPLVLACLACAGGCSNYHTSGPEAWWHETIGGKIAAERPPPPGDKDPFPNLASVPAKPPPANTAEWNQRTTGLITDRIKADQAAALAPIPAPASGPAASVTFGADRQAQPKGQEPAASAALTAAPRPTAIPKAPQAGAAQTATAGSAPAGAQGTSAAERVADAKPPVLPIDEPPPPGIAPARRPPVVPLTATPPSPVVPAAGGTEIDFSRASATLNDPALTEVKALAAVRGDHGIAITGYGDATSSDPLAQSDALGLGLSRAQALATALVAQGVPVKMLRLNAEAAGRGASLRLLQ